MSSVLRLLPLLGVWVLALISPGPDFVATARFASARSRRDGVLVGLGVTSAIAVWISASVLGLALLLARVSWLYDSVRLAGAAYLTYLGVRALMSARHRSAPEDAQDGSEATEPAATDRPEVKPAVWALWRVGFLTNLGNPKAAVFFGSLFTALLPAHPAVWLQGTAALTMLVMAAGWFTTVACLFSLAPIARGYRRAKRAIDVATGCVFIALAGRLAVE